MAKMFFGKYFPPSMVTKLRNEITNFRQRPDESLFEAWERYKLSIDRCPNHNMLPDIFAQWSESSSSITCSSDLEIVALKAKMTKINKNLMKVLQINQQVKAVTHNCETYGGPQSYNDCPATVGQTQNVYVVGAYNKGGNSYNLKATVICLAIVRTIISDHQGLIKIKTETIKIRTSKIKTGIKETIMEFLSGTTKEETNSSKELVMVKTRLQLIKARLIKARTNITSLTNSNLELKNMFGQLMKMNTASSSDWGTLPSNTVTNPKEDLKGITTRSGTTYKGPTIPTTSSSSHKVVEPVTFNLDQTSRYSTNYNDMTANQIDVIDMACEKYSQEVLGFSDVIASGNPTPYYDPIISTSSPTLTPFGDSDFLLEEVDAFLSLEDNPTSPEVDHSYYDTEGIWLVRTKNDKSSIDEPPEVELKDLPPHLEYAFLEGDDKLPVIIAKDLSVEEKAALIKDEFKPAVQHQRRVNPKIHDVIKKEVKKLLDARLIYPISDSPWPPLAKRRTYMLREPIKVVILTNLKGNNQGRNQFFQGASHGQNPPPAYQAPGHTIPTISSSLPKIVKCETEVTKDTVPPTNNESTKDIQPPIVQIETPEPNSEPIVSLVSAPKPNQKPSIPYPSRLHDQKLRDKTNDQKVKFFQIFQDLNFNISFADALILMPKFCPTIKILLTNKDKLYELDRTPLNEHCSAVLLKKLLGKLGDPGKFLILCDFLGIDECLTLADLGTIINLMPLFVWNKLPLPELIPTLMTLELADRDFLLEEVDAFLTLEDDPTLPKVDHSYYDTEGDILILEAFLNDDPLLPPLNQGMYLPQV
nr:reverse transcriptase domain-containing protein [Tanacetum cinerariifolium]